MPDFDSKINSYLEPSEVRRLIDAVPHVSRVPARDALLIETMWQSGTRVSEAITLRPEWVGQTSIIFTNLKQYKRVKQPNGKMIRVSNPQAVKEVEVSEALCTALHDWVKEQKIEPGRWVFRGKFKGGHVSRSYVWRLMDKLGKDTGILKFGKNNPRTGIRFKGPTPHSLRHSLGMALQKASGGDLSLVGQQLGHSSIASTAIYARTKKPEIKRVVREMDWGQRKEPIKP